MCDLPFLIIATGSPSGDALQEWLLVLGFLVAIAVGIKKLFEKKPSHAELATKEELKGYAKDTDLKEFKTEVRVDLAQIEGRIDGAMTKVESLHREAMAKLDEYSTNSYKSRQGIHKDVNRIDKSLTKVETRQSEQKDQISKVERRQDEHVEKVIQSLTNNG